MCITDIDDCNNIIVSSLSIKDIVSISRVNKRSYNNIKHNVLYKDITKLKSKRKIGKQMIQKGLLSLLIHVQGKMKLGNIVYHAIKHGQIKILNWHKNTLLKNNQPIKCHRTLTNVACEKGHVESLDWLFENTTFLFNDDAIHNAINNNHFHVVEWFHNHGFIKKNKDYTNSLYKNPYMLIWFIEHKLHKLKHNDIISILAGYQTKTLTMLKEHGYINDYYMNVIKTWLRSNSNYIKNIKNIKDDKWLMWLKDNNVTYDCDAVRFWLAHDFLNIINILDENKMLEPNTKEYIKNYTLNNPTRELIKWGIANNITYNVQEYTTMYWTMLKESPTYYLFIGVPVAYMFTVNFLL